MIDGNKVAERLVNLRGNMTQQEVANAIGVSVSAISMYESGSRIPRDEVKLALSRLFHTSVESIFFAE